MRNKFQRVAGSEPADLTHDRSAAFVKTPPMHSHEDSERNAEGNATETGVPSPFRPESLWTTPQLMGSKLELLFEEILPVAPWLSAGSKSSAR